MIHKMWIMCYLIYERNIIKNHLNSKNDKQKQDKRQEQKLRKMRKVNFKVKKAGGEKEQLKKM